MVQDRKVDEYLSQIQSQWCYLQIVLLIYVCTQILSNRKVFTSSTL